MTPPRATYRLQLRNGVTFDTATELLPELDRLGFSHLYLSPIFTAQSGSTHGYDITDPNEIDPTLGGEAGYLRLSEQAQARDIGLILDIVPNHTAFSPENPWLHDVLRHGTGSRYAGHFDIDRSKRLVLPWLPAPFEEMRIKGDIALSEDAMTVGDLTLPLAPGTRGDDLGSTHDAQHWRLTHWRFERDGITHRRFFSITGLIGMRVEDPQVFEGMHEKIFELIASGHVQGLRVDHIDGLADPAQYLDRLASRVGPTPIWVEKILTGDEELPAGWPVEGTTGYEVAQQIVRVLTDPKGHGDLMEAWALQTGDMRAFHAAVLEAKREILPGELAAELHQLIALAEAALDPNRHEIGPETLRTAVLELLVAFPHYRSYLTGAQGTPDDRQLLSRAAERAASHADGRAVKLLADRILHGKSEPAERLQTRFQQVSGALLAKSHEDTAAFRQTAYLAACEVGADPDAVTLESDAMQSWCRARPTGALSLTASHDTKRSADARMRMVALSHRPAQFLALLEGATRLETAKPLKRAEHWYILQSAIAIWTPDAESFDTRASRLGDHVVKAFREAGVRATWLDPDPHVENEAQAFAQALFEVWREKTPEALSEIIALGDHLGLAQVVLHMLLPGVPDVYQSDLWADHALTDPDNRRPVAFWEFKDAPEGTCFEGRKFGLRRGLLRLRRENPELFTAGGTRWGHNAGGFTLERHLGDQSVSARVAHETRRIEIRHNKTPLPMTPIEVPATG